MKKSLYLFPLLLTACASGPPLDSVPEPTVVISTSSTQKVSNKISEVCNRRGYQIDEVTSNSVTCSTRANDMAQLFFGTDYGNEVRKRTKFNIFSIRPKQVKVVTQQWLENQTALGQTKRTDFDTVDNRKLLNYFLSEVKSEIRN